MSNQETTEYSGITLTGGVRDIDFLAIMMAVEQECKRQYNNDQVGYAIHLREVIKALQMGNPKRSRKHGRDPENVPPLEDISDLPSTEREIAEAEKKD